MERATIIVWLCVLTAGLALTVAGVFIADRKRKFPDPMQNGFGDYPYVEVKRPDASKSKSVLTSAAQGAARSKVRAGA